MNGAAKNRPEPPADMLDTCLYMGLYSLYSAYYGGVITREQAKPIKNRLISAYRKQKGSWDFAAACQKAATEFWLRVERSLDDYAANPSRETADRLWAVASGLSGEALKCKGSGCW